MRQLKAQKWVDELLSDGMNSYEMACAITNGEIELADGIGYTAIDTDTIGVFDLDIGVRRFVQLG